jgi:two-component system sensor histidine kinase TtrS
VVINSHDITTRDEAERNALRLQNELAHMARLNTMSEMAASFAHELNQPLTAIHNYARGCVRRLQADSASLPEIREAMEATARQAERAGAVIRRIRWFMRRDEPELTPIDINAIVPRPWTWWGTRRATPAWSWRRRWARHCRGCGATPCNFNRR